MAAQPQNVLDAAHQLAPEISVHGQPGAHHVAIGHLGDRELCSPTTFSLYFKNTLIAVC